MIDIHSHLIPGIDDGSSCIEDTFKMFEEAKEAGFTDIILTPHYITEYYEPTREELLFWKEKLNSVLEKKDIELKLHSGMEIYLSEQMKELIKKNKIITLANSRYMLIELPISSKINFFDSIIFILQSLGIQVVLAHPERYLEAQKKPQIVEEYVKKGCLIQCNYGSILNMYGEEAKRTLKILLKKDLVHFLGSDCHKKETIYTQTKMAIKKIQNIIGKNKTYLLTTVNPKKILKNEEW